MNAINTRSIRRFMAEEEGSGTPITGTTTDQVAWDVIKRLGLHPSFYRKVNEIVIQLINQAKVVLRDAILHVCTNDECGEIIRSTSQQESHDRRLRHRAESKRSARRLREQLYYSHQTTLALQG